MLIVPRFFHRLLYMNIIFVLHLLMLVAAVVVPMFVKDVRWLEMYSLFIPFVFFHWITNDDTCCLTQLEVYLTGQDKSKTFMSRVLDPVYNVSDDTSGKLIKLSAFALWMLVQVRLGRINTIMGLKSK
ncbi:hypothetical protein MPVG_00175 [Micromonas pusilla virus 12T]|jgi:hypothetical protein|uniref:hypothetical protein n=1 Tax=Micromonas pusilla virus 12T TaxID=755272 RepID=UPI0002C062FE|nr:hypothetical protein MPVG_00175 [Micromonas pusilla virus 12T]AGH30995.1 hypothetical protein MPVG_00175 [Micromonas pusilla virus 12T]